MGYVFLFCQCIACGQPISCNPLTVPTLVVNGEREPLCRGCFARWNEIHRTSQGLPPIPLAADAYEPADEYVL